MTSSHAEPPDLAAAVVRLVRQLRARGARTTTGSSVEALRTLGVVDLLDRDEVRRALRIVLVTRPEDLDLFDEVFDRAWEPWTSARTAVSDAEPRAQPPTPASTRRAPVTLRNWMRVGDGGEGGDDVPVRAPSDDEQLASRDFSAWTESDVQALRRLARRIARRLARRRSRRWRVSQRGRVVDLRGTLRHAVRTAGELIRVYRRDRRIRRTRLVAICDVSGSMELYSRFLLQFLHAMHHSVATIESFVFSTRLSRITEHLRGAAYGVAVRQLGRDVHDWSGGTRIGTAIEQVVRDHHRHLTRRTVVLILSDGWDVGDPAVLDRAMAGLRRRVGKVIWLNPLMGALDYTPATRGMQAALRHVDLLAPAHSLDALERLAPRLAP
ncbi:MAG: VWA domain-containing protein [Gemmatimonadaceae bacterium]|nr:VWA domain-containing protein [Gemmatimonadaceae bacterium]